MSWWQRFLLVHVSMRSYYYYFSFFITQVNTWLRNFIMDLQLFFHVFCYVWKPYCRVCSWNIKDIILTNSFFWAQTAIHSTQDSEAKLEVFFSANLWRTSWMHCSIFYDSLWCSEDKVTNSGRADRAAGVHLPSDSVRLSSQPIFIHIYLTSA